MVGPTVGPFVSGIDHSQWLHQVRLGHVRGAHDAQIIHLPERFQLVGAAAGPGVCVEDVEDVFWNR